MEKASTEEWTDGKLLIQKIPLDEVVVPGEEYRYRFFLCDEQLRSETKSYRDLFGWNEGPLGANRHWSLEELSTMFQEWMSSIPEYCQKDVRLIESIRILLFGAHPDGFHCQSHMIPLRTMILCSLTNFIILYIQRQTPPEFINSMSLLSI